MTKFLTIFNKITKLFSIKLHFLTNFRDYVHVKIWHVQMLDKTGIYLIKFIKMK